MADAATALRALATWARDRAEEARRHQGSYDEYHPGKYDAYEACADEAEERAAAIEKAEAT